MSGPWLFRRQSEADRRQQDAFLADIAAHWDPTTPGQRWLHLRSLGVHLWVRLFGGEPTLAPAAVAAIPMFVGTTLLMFAPRPAEFDPGPPDWSYLFLSIGMLGFVVQAFVSPRRVRVWWIFLAFGLPTAIGSAVSVMTLRMVVPSDQLFRAGTALFIVAAALLLAASLTRGARRRTMVLAGLKLSGVCMAATVVADIEWAWMTGTQGHAMLAWGCAATALGGALMALAFLHASPASD